MKMGTLINLGLLRTLEAGFSYLFAMMFKKPETSLENFYINRFGKKLYSMFLRTIPKSFGADIRETFRRIGARSV